MANPVFLLNSTGQRVDSILKADGTVLRKLAIGQKTLGGGITPEAAWQGIATHAGDDAAFSASDGVVVLAGLEGTQVRPVLVDSAGRVIASKLIGGSLKNGNRNAVDTAVLQLSTSSVPCTGVLIKARDANINDVWIGTSAVTSNTTEATGGYRLAAGASIGVPCRNLNEVYLRWAAFTSGDGVEFIASID